MTDEAINIAEAQIGLDASLEQTMLLNKEKPQSSKQKATVSSLLEYGFGDFPIDDETYRKLSEKSVKSG